jgi:hypothetical protein
VAIIHTCTQRSKVTHAPLCLCDLTVSRVKELCVSSLMSCLFYISEQLYGNRDRIEERHRHRYEVNPKYVPQLESAGMKFVGKLCVTHIVEWEDSMLRIKRPSIGRNFEPVSFFLALTL